MLLIVVVAFVATVGFYRRAREIGIRPGKAASVPFIAANAMIAVSYLFAVATGRLFTAINVSAETSVWMGLALEWLLAFAYVFFIKRNWDTLCMVNCPGLATGERGADNVEE